MKNASPLRTRRFASQSPRKIFSRQWRLVLGLLLILSNSTAAFVQAEAPDPQARPTKAAFLLDLFGGEKTEEALKEKAAAFVQLEEEAVKKVQDSLKALGYDAVEVAGVLSSKTRLALKHFREDFKIPAQDLTSDEIVKTLSRYAEILKPHPDWKTTLSSEAFIEWNAANPPPISLDGDGTIAAEQLVKIASALERFEKTKAQADLPAAPSAPKPATAPPKEAAEKDPKAEAEAARTAALKNPQQKEADASPPQTGNGMPIAKTEAPPSPPDAPQKPAAAGSESKTPSPPQAMDIPSSEQTKKESTGTAPSTAASTPEIVTATGPEATVPPEESAAAPSDAQAAPDDAGLPPDILSQIRAGLPFTPGQSVQWSGGGCGCVADLSGVVYGFYPYWLAGAPQEIDFSLLTRIAYHALSFDRSGKITDLRHWKPEAAGFITEAQKHQTKLDVVIYKNDWQEWFTFSAKDRLYITDLTTTNIVNAVHQKLPDPSPLHLKTLVSSESSSRMGDGVTLFFDHYPEDEIAVRFFLDFVETLRKKLKATGEDYTLNLMLPMDAIGKGVYTYQNLEEFMNKEDNSADDEIDLFLVILEGAQPAQPLEDKNLAPKKVLRAQIEKQYSGIRRRNMLRKIVPVIQALSEKSEQAQQFEDDLIYFEDNFGGVGFWPLPIAGAPETEAVKAQVTSIFKEEEGLGFLAQSLPVNDTDYCKFVCPNRWAFRLAYDLVFGLLGAYGLIATGSALFRNVFEKFRVYFLGLGGGGLLVFYSALMCDPYLSDKKGWAILALFLAGVFYLILKAYRKMKREAYP